jgi:ABC-type multidrug transport system fused ATPase/permease subunit
MEILRVLRSTIMLLNPRDQVKLVQRFLVLIVLSLLDVLGLIALSLMISQIVPSSTPNLINSILEHVRNLSIFSGLSDKSFGNLTLLFSLIFFAAKTVFSLKVISGVFEFLSKIQILKTENLVKRILDSDYEWERRQDPHQISSSLITGVSASVVNSLGNFLVVCAEIVTVTLYLTIVFILDLKLGIATLIYGFLVFFLMNKFLSEKISKINKDLYQLRIDGQKSIFDVIGLFREIRISGHGLHYQRDVKRKLEEHSKLLSYDATLQLTPKFLIEFFMAVAIFLVILYYQMLTDSGSPVGVLGVFLFVLIRIFPSLLKIQSSVMTVRSFQQMTTELLDLEKTLSNSNSADVSRTNSSAMFTHKFQNIRFDTINFKYQDSEHYVIQDLSLQINGQTKIAIVGSSGSGKSTFIDLLAGLLSPTSGSITADGIPIKDLYRDNPNVLGYLPQVTYLIEGSILQNICLGVDSSEIDTILLDQALINSGLSKLISERSLSLDQMINSLSSNLSGGEKQKIGLARIFYENPSLMILDEATSSLDAESEAHLLEGLLKPGTGQTIIFIAHRLNAIKGFDRVIFFEDGRVLGDGDYESLQNSLPIFKKFTEKMGL